MTLRLLLACDEPEGGARSLVRGKTWVEAGPGLVSSSEENGGEGKEEEEEEEEEESKPPAGRAASRPLASQLAASDGAVAQARLTQNQLSQQQKKHCATVCFPGKVCTDDVKPSRSFWFISFYRAGIKTAPR